MSSECSEYRAGKRINALELGLRELTAEVRANDRRYREIEIEREKARQIKEIAGARALGLAREIQQYKDEKANELRAQIESERGLYPSKEALAAAVSELRAEMKPALDLVSRSKGVGMSWAWIAAAIGVLAAIVAMMRGAL